MKELGTILDVMLNAYGIPIDRHLYFHDEIDQVLYDSLLALDPNIASSIPFLKSICVRFDGNLDYQLVSTNVYDDQKLILKRRILYFSLHSSKLSPFKSSIVPIRLAIKPEDLSYKIKIIGESWKEDTNRKMFDTKVRRYLVEQAEDDCVCYEFKGEDVYAED